LVTFAKIQRYSIALWREMVWHCSDWELGKRGTEEEVESGQVPYAERKMIVFYFRNERKREDGDATSEQ